MAKIENTIYESLHEVEHPYTDNLSVKMTLSENTSSNEKLIQIRKYRTAGHYIGPTKDGLGFKVSSVEELEQFRRKFNDFLDGAKKHLEQSNK